MPRFYGRIRCLALLPVQEVQHQRHGGDERNHGSYGEPYAAEREQRRPRRADPLGLGGEVVRRPLGTRTVIARGLLVPRRVSHRRVPRATSG